MAKKKKISPEESGRRGGLVGGRASTPAKRRAVRENGKLGGRPRKKKPPVGQPRGA